MIKEALQYIVGLGKAEEHSLPLFHNIGCMAWGNGARSPD